jgi:phage anti-repressor protein
METTLFKGKMSTIDRVTANMTASGSFDVVSLIERNPITKLSVAYQSRLVNKLKHVFTDEEQRMFVTSFYGYLKYKPDELVVSLDDVWEWLGFSTKGNAFRKMQKHFQQDEDYIITGLIRSDKQENCPNLLPGGHNKENIMMTINTFKKLCLKAQTKKADSIHTYYVKLEQVLQELIDEESSELREQLAHNIQMRVNTENALKAEKERCAKLQKKKCYEQENGETVYIYKSSPKDDGHNFYKVGRTTSIARRECDFISSNINGEVVHVCRCLNSELLEKVCHHILDKFRVLNAREWFEAPFPVIKNAVTGAHMFLDGFIDNIEDVDLYAALTALKSPECIQPTPEAPKPNMYLVAQQREQQRNEDIDDILRKASLSKITIIDPLNYAKFIDDSCELGDDTYVTLKAEIHGAHKQWSRNSEAATKKSLFNYLETRFKSGKKYFEEYKAYLAVYYGVRVKPIIFKPLDPANPTEVEQYIISNCKTGFVYRAPFRAFYEDFEKWKALEIPNYKINTEAKTKLRDYLSTHFFPKGVHLSGQLNDIDGGKNYGYGVWGITLKDDTSNTGIKLANKLRKEVVKIDVATKQVVAKYESVVASALACNVTPAFISSDIKFKRVRNNHMFMLLKDFDELFSLQVNNPTTS